MKKYVGLLLLLTIFTVGYAQENVVKHWEYDINGKNGIACRYVQSRNLLFMSGFSVADNDVFGSVVKPSCKSFPLMHIIS